VIAKTAILANLNELYQQLYLETCLGSKILIFSRAIERKWQKAVEL
jgi:hypothetical protein